MQIINLNKRIGVKTIEFPDGQPHIELDKIECCEPVKVIVSIDCPKRLLELCMVSNALDSKMCDKKLLRINYLMGARYDRHMKEERGDSFDLKVISDIINSLNFDKVEILDPHSPVSLDLVRNSVGISNQFLVERYHIPETLIICPDKGARLKVEDYANWNPNLLKTPVYCTKARDLSTGAVTLAVEDAQECDGRPCIIIDDICDGGATFLAIAEQIKPSHLTLMVTHGIFSKGLIDLTSKFDVIITSDSICKDVADKLTVHKVPEYEVQREEALQTAP